MKYFIKLWRKIKDFFFIDHEGPFGWSPEEFKKAKRWAKNQPHPKFPDHPSYSLWDYVNNTTNGLRITFLKAGTLSISTVQIRKIIFV